MKLEPAAKVSQTVRLRFLHMFPRSVRSAMFIDIW